LYPTCAMAGEVTWPIIVLNAKLVIVAIEMPFALVFVSKTYITFSRTEKYLDRGH
jgi:hypothetical protein